MNLYLYWVMEKSEYVSKSYKLEQHASKAYFMTSSRDTGSLSEKVQSHQRKCNKPMYINSYRNKCNYGRLVPQIKNQLG